MASSDTLKKDLLEAVFNHLVLPPGIPGKQDTDLEAISDDIVRRAIHATGTVLHLMNETPWRKEFEDLRDSLQICLELNRGSLERGCLLKHFKNLAPRSVLILYLNQQNAGLLVRSDKQKGLERVIFESFEASASSTEVIAAGHSMRWDFPGRSAHICMDDFCKESFQKCLATFLEQASMESLYYLQASTHKAGVIVEETRDTTDPALITQFLMPLLEAVGASYQAPILRKNVRDDVNLVNDIVPWRRLPFWLILRVAAQRQLCFALGSEQGQVAYKVLIAILLAELLDQSSGIIDPHKITTLRNKLARRMVKLEMNQEHVNLQGDPAYRRCFGAASAVVRGSIEATNRNIEATWDIFKQKTARRIPHLPSRAPSESLELTLSNSGKYLDEILSTRDPQQSSAPSSPMLPEILDPSIKRSEQFMKEAFKLAALEQRISEDASQPMSSHQDPKKRCMDLEDRIGEVFSAEKSIHTSDPEHTSAMLLAVFTLWIELDKSALEACPWLADYAPVFSPELLDALQLPTKPAMEQLQKIQEYLAHRKLKSLHSSILTPRSGASIAVRFRKTSRELQHLERLIQGSCNDARKQKAAERDRLCREYGDHIDQMRREECCCTREGDQRIVRNCTRCWHWRASQRISISIHENFLPTDTDARSMVVFELGIPYWFAAYRSTSWDLLSRLAHPDRPKSAKAEIILEDCEPLLCYKAYKYGRLTLASTVKCFQNTHYKFCDGIIPLDRVLLPFAARFKLYDSRLDIWVEDLKRPLTLEHYCGIQIPGSLSLILPKEDHPPTTVKGPSSYEVQANQAVSPTNIPVQAFCAHQKLLAGERRRWPNLLVELCSSNLNFSDESTMRMICQLAIQAGPKLSNEALRIVHEVFKQSVFTRKLTNTLNTMLQSIQGNWRESNIMQIIITFALRLFNLSEESRSLGAGIIIAARKCLLKWISKLRHEIHETLDSTKAQNYANYSLHAALLCRKTFVVHCRSEMIFGQEDLASWIRASLAVQENIFHDYDELSTTLRDLVHSDAKMVYHLQPYIHHAMADNWPIVGAEITRGLIDAKSSSPWTFLPAPFDHWIVSSTMGDFPERLHFNYIEGHLLINGKPRSKLPLAIANDDSVKFIFGNQHLFTYPSRQPGFPYRLTRPREGNGIFFGLRNGRVIIRATRYNPESESVERWEYVPQRILSTTDSSDLPAELIWNCGHWLNIKSRRLEIRRGLPETAAFWKTRQRDWFVDIPNRSAYRGTSGSQLVDPQSSTFKFITSIFHGFVSPKKLTVFQPKNGKLTVEVKHLDLRFWVNSRNLLECQQLSAEIDTDQDPGTWYGLRSHIVMRDIETSNRSVIVPLGKAIVYRDGIHVGVRIIESSGYAKFKIDRILGRLTCGPEPRLTYTKALYHGLTSFCIPDVLTGRTGASEAFAILQSSVARPWAPVIEAEHILGGFERLVPKREYYPPNIKRIQSITWDLELTLSIQCDAYRSLIEEIKERSNSLGKFTAEAEFKLRKISHLCHRGRAQRQIYSPLVATETGVKLPKLTYTPRDREIGVEAHQVYTIARVILSKCGQFHVERTLMEILKPFKIIQGSPDLDTPGNDARPLICQIEAPINENWGELVDFCRHTTEPNLLFRLGLLAFSKNVDMDAIQCLAAICLVDEIRELNPPQHKCFEDFRSRGAPTTAVIEKLIKSAYPKFRSSGASGKASATGLKSRGERDHDKACGKEGLEISKLMLRFWPMPPKDLTVEFLSAEFDISHKVSPKMIDMGLAWNNVRPEWEREYANLELADYLSQVDMILGSLNRERHETTKPTYWTATDPQFKGAQYSISYQSIVRDWTAKDGPRLSIPENDLPRVRSEDQHHTTNTPTDMVSLIQPLSDLDRILGKLQQSNSELRKQYAIDLYQSLRALQLSLRERGPQNMAVNPDLNTIDEAIIKVQNLIERMRNEICTAFISGENRSMWLELGFMKPVSTTTDLLKLLRSTAPFHVGTGMKRAIVSYGITITKLQQLFRIKNALLRKDHQALHNELHSQGHRTWDPIQEPDWLLLEIDSNILIRPEQVAVARAIIGLEPGNRVLQLSMGKGKTSCIVPMTQAVLANGTNLSRVVVPKALIMQTAQTMQTRLGDLVGREIIHIPFSRRTSTEEEMLDQYARLHHDTRQNHGIMLTCAEHVLSYRLSGWQKFLDSKNSTADQMIQFQKWLDTHCRDVLDECDFTLSVKTQLNYPSGPQMSVDFHPFRWQIAEELLALAASHLRDLRNMDPKGIQTTTEDALNQFLADDICSGRLTCLRFAHPQAHKSKVAIRDVLLSPKITDRALNHAAGIFHNPNIAMNAILLVRGLLLHKIIILCLSKRWNIQYGLHPNRSPISVPYEAKGKPSEQSEYGHPDVAIILTCLSFYYAGLTQEQLIESVKQVLRSGDPAVQYERWSSTSTKLPASLRQWNIINTDDMAQMERLWRVLRGNPVVINHFLNNFVFPVHAQQFAIKLQASSWDIPMSPENNTQLIRTTGFSGTNDNRLMLPLTIRQNDLPELRHTSAEVLSYLLQERNREFHVIADLKGERLTEMDFLRDLKEKRITVLIDVGAYISEMQNHEIAQAWLMADPDAKAVAYFRNDDKAWVHFRSTTKADMPLLATPFADDLSGCSVYLDEGHTRGVDLRLPLHARGAVTLALKLTKDHTVQAAMRLRQLQTTQSVVFYGPPEVDQSIRDYCGLKDQKIDSYNVVSWLLEQTCRSIEDLQGLYIAQGLEFCQRTDAILHCKNFMTNQSDRQRLFRVLKQPERKTLRELYGPSVGSHSKSLEDNLSSAKLRSFASTLVQTSKDQLNIIQVGALEEVEQEREVEAQAEQVRKVEEKKKYAALSFLGVHPDIKHFAATGTLEFLEPAETSNLGFEHAFAFVGKTAIGERFGVHKTNSNLFVSSEFTKTVEVAPDSQGLDNFLRPVEWIVWSPKTKTALVIIPEEAEYMLGFLRDLKDESHVHLLAYAAPVTKSMVQFNELRFYSVPELPDHETIPQQIKIELGILGGRLYLDEGEWEEMEKYVRGSETDTVEDSDKIAPDLPAFLLEWLAMRRNTVDVLHTHMGYICTGRKLMALGETNNEVEK
ncbi:hypothetical protein F4777DRAFT_594856 [Nemania sp. FL0916]|nr:hypothetical protein F4777DRAFT_594856 [Nemania sp. FL0916]